MVAVFMCSRMYSGDYFCIVRTKKHLCIAKHYTNLLFGERFVALLQCLRRFVRTVPKLVYCIKNFLSCFWSHRTFGAAGKNIAHHATGDARLACNIKLCYRFLHFFHLSLAPILTYCIKVFNVYFLFSKKNAGWRRSPTGTTILIFLFSKTNTSDILAHCPLAISFERKFFHHSDVPVTLNTFMLGRHLPSMSKSAWFSQLSLIPSAQIQSPPQ